MSTSTQAADAAAAPSPAPRTEGVTPLQQAIVAVLACAFLLYPYLFSGQPREDAAFGSELVGDGLELVTQHPVLLAVQEDPSQLGKTLTAPWWQGIHDNQQLYRPVSLFTLGLAGAAAGPYDPQKPGKTPFPYHFLVLLLNVGCALLVMDVAFQILGSARSAFVAGALFAVLPVHGEVLFDVVGIAELLCTVLSLAAWGMWLRAGAKPLARPLQLGASLVFLFLATLAKESAFALPLVFFLMDVGRAPAGAEGKGGLGAGFKHALSKLPALVACLVVLGLSYGLRSAMLDGGPVYGPQNYIDNPLISVDAGTRVMNGVRVLAASLPIMLGLNPLLGGIGFSPDYSFEQVPVLGAFSVPNLIGLVAVVVVLGLALALFRKCRTRSALVLVLFGSLLLTSNLLFPIGTIFGERLLFFPSVALVIFLAAFLGRLGSLGTVGGLAASLVCGALLYSDAGRWSTQPRLWDWAVKAAPESAKAHFNRGVSLYKDTITAVAKNEFERAIEIYPKFVLAHAALGSLNATAYETEEAIEELTKALDIQLEASGYRWTPEVPSPVAPSILLYQIAQLRVHGEDPDPEGELAYLDSLRAKGYHSPHVELRRAEALVKLGRNAEAEQAYKESLAIRDTFAARRSYGELLVHLGRVDEAEETMNPDPDTITREGDRIELSIARGWAMVGSDPAGALRIAEDLLEERSELTAQQVFHVKHLQATAKLDLYDADPSAGVDRLQDIKRNLMGGITAWPMKTEDNYIARRMLCRLMFVLHEDEELTSELQNLLQYRDGPAHRTMLGKVYTRLGQLEEAAEQFERASQATLTDDGVYVNEEVLYEARRLLLLTYSAMGVEDRALAAIESWHEAAPGAHDRMALFLHANWLAGQGDLDGALEKAQTLAAEFPEEPRSELLILTLERMQKLEQDVSEGLAALPELDELARLRYGFDDWDGAIELLSQALALTDRPANKANLEQMISDVLEESGDMEGALEHARAAVAFEGVPAETKAEWQKRLGLLEAIVGA